MKAIQLGISQKANPNPINRGWVALPPGSSHRHPPPPAGHQSHHRPSEGLGLTQGRDRSETTLRQPTPALAGTRAPHLPLAPGEAEMPANHICVLQSSAQNLSLSDSRVLTLLTSPQKKNKHQSEGTGYHAIEEPQMKSGPKTCPGSALRKTSSSSSSSFLLHAYWGLAPELGALQMSPLHPHINPRR